jgi:hypothetical protein
MQFNAAHQRIPTKFNAENFQPRLSGLIARLCYSIRRLSANRVAAKPPKLGFDEFRHH